MNKSSWKKRFYKGTLYVIYLLAIVFICLEIILRIYYPFATRIRGDRFELSVNTRYTLRNNFNPRLDPLIVHNKNSIGFRGAEPPKNISACLSILTIGGSTTECTWLSEGKTWPDRLNDRLQPLYTNVWVNNAGLDGHSTFGNLNLLHYYIPTLSFRPRIALFLIGANDVNRDDLDGYDPTLNNGPLFKIKKWTLRHSETVNFIYDLKNTLHPPDIFPRKDTLLPSHPLDSLNSQNAIDSVKKIQYPLIPAFKKRLELLIAECSNMHIRPVLMTQPLAVNENSPMGAWKLFWYALQPYNETTRQVARAAGVPCIDLAALMPADTAFYYDMLHYTNAGAEKVSEIIATELIPRIDGNFADHQKPDRQTKDRQNADHRKK